MTPSTAAAAAGVSLLEWTLLANVAATTELILVRHGQQGVNDLDDPMRTRGGDAPLSPLGLRQAALAAEALASENVSAVYCSDLRRARATAAPIAASHGITPRIVPDLREVGVYRDIPAGRTVRDTLGKDRYRDVAEAFVRTRSWDAFPYSETSAAFRSRVGAAVDAIIADADPGHRVVVVCHGGVINSEVRRTLELNRDMVFYPAHASVTRLAFSGERRAVHSLNETHFLRTAGAEFVTY